MTAFLRAKNRLHPACYIGRNSYFITACVENRKPILNDASRVDALQNLLREVAATHEFRIYAFCFMPDHLHFAPVGFSDQSSLRLLLRDLKGRSTAILRSQGLRNVWQKGFHDHINRPGELDAVAGYIFENPVRAGLARTIFDWPYSGSFMFNWRKFAPAQDPFVPPWKKPLPL